MTAPFRWDLSRREQLGALVDPETNPPPEMREEDRLELRRVAARVLAMSQGADLAFIGRTPENLFDYLSGAFLGLPRLPELALVPFSLRWMPEGGLEQMPAANRKGLLNHIRGSILSPEKVASSASGVALVDFVAYGGTFQSLTAVLMATALEDGIDWNAVQRKLTYIGLRSRTKNSPNTHRWQQKAGWLDLVPDAQVRNVSCEPGWIMLLANWQPKTTPPFSFGRWPEEEDAPVPRRPENLEALAMAVSLFDLGNTRDERHALAGEMAETFQYRHRSVRQMASQLRVGGS